MIKKYTLTIFFCIILFTESTAQIALDDPSWELYLFDDFTGSAVNTNIWNIINDSDHGGEAQCYRTQNVAVSNGNLVLTLKNEYYEYEECSSGVCKKKPHNYTSGCVELKRLKANGDPQYLKYGYIEGKIAIPYLANDKLWPAFWTSIGDHLLYAPYNQNIYSSASEIDIFEQLAGGPCGAGPADNCDLITPQDDNTLGTGIYLSYNPLVVSYEYASLPYSYALPKPGSGDIINWHTYAVEWSPYTITWYFDGYPIRRYKNPPNITHNPWLSEPYNGGGIHDPLKIILNLAYQGNATTINQSMLIDYVKIYRLKQDCQTTINQSSYDFTNYDNKVKNSIQLGGPGGTMTFPNLNISLKAGQFIQLNEGFYTPTSTTTYIDVPGCY